MPSVFTLEGAHLGIESSGNNMDVIHYPEWGSPISTANGSPIGPARPQPPVYGPGGTPIMYRRRYPSRGPVCEYCDPRQYATLGDAVDTLQAQSDAVGGLYLAGGALVLGAALGGLAIWLFNKGGYRSAKRED